MEITEELLDQIGNLAKIDIPADQRGQMMQEMERMLAYFRKMEEADAGDEEPLVSVCETENVFREDLPTNPDGRENALLNAPVSMDGLFLVPKTF